MGVIAQRLVEGNLADGSALTVTGRTLAEEAADARETPGQEVILPLDKALKPRGGIAILRGSLAPEGLPARLARAVSAWAIAPSRCASCVAAPPSAPPPRKGPCPAPPSVPHACRPFPPASPRG